MKHVDLSTESGEAVPQFLKDRLDPFRTAFTEPTWRLARVLAMGALLVLGKRTVSSCLRITGNAECKSFSSYHQVLNRAQWEPSDLSKILLQHLVANLVEEEPIVIGLDDTIERRWGPMIDARGIYRDPTRSSLGHFVKTSGLRWLCFTLLTPLPWKTGIKALPFQTLLAPSERYCVSKRGLRHKKLTDWARQGMLQTIRWLPDRKVIFVGDSSFGTHDLANSISKHGTLISRLRLDANLFELPPETNNRGRPRIKGAPLPKLKSYLNAADECWTKVTPSHWYGAKEKTLEIISDTGLWYRAGTPPTLLRWVLVRDPDRKMEPQAFFCTDTDMDPADVISNFAKRWEMEVTFQEVRTHLGVETQRQWSKKAIARTTPALLGLYSLVCLWAQQALESNRMSYAAAWYKKTNFTFSDAIAVIRCEIFLSHSPPDRECDKNQSRLFKRLLYALCFPS